MNKPDNLGKYMKELPMEDPSAGFTVKVMDRVLAESGRASVPFHPLISLRMWMQLLAGSILLVSGIALLRTYFPGNENPAGWQSLYNYDLSVVFDPFLKLSGIAQSLPVSFAFGLMAITFLLLADRVYSRHTAR